MAGVLCSLIAKFVCIISGKEVPSREPHIVDMEGVKHLIGGCAIIMLETCGANKGGRTAATQLCSRCDIFHPRAATADAAFARD